MVQKKNIIILLYFAPKSKPKGQILPKEPLKICVNIQRKAGYIYISLHGHQGYMMQLPNG